MLTVTARFADGRALIWTDGKLSGDPVRQRWLNDPLEEWVPVLPEGPEFRTDRWREDPWSFVAACKVVDPRERPTIEVDGLMPSLMERPANAV